MSAEYRDPRAQYQPPPRGAYWSPPHHPEAVFVNAPKNGNSSDTSVKQLTVPVLMALSVAAVLVGATYTLTVEFSDLKYQILRLGEKVDQASSGQTDRIKRVEQALEDRTSDRWTRTAHDLWCARTEQLNRGWKCAEGPGEARRGAGETQAWRPVREGKSARGN